MLLCGRISVSGANFPCTQSLILLESVLHNWHQRDKADVSADERLAQAFSGHDAKHVAHRLSSPLLSKSTKWFVRSFEAHVSACALVGDIGRTDCGQYACRIKLPVVQPGRDRWRQRGIIASDLAALAGHAAVENVAPPGR
jgi:hypothetical protein